MLLVGEITRNGTIERGKYKEGLIYKDEEAFINKKGTCYVAELDDHLYSYGDFLRAAKGNEEIAKELFYGVHWQTPDTLYEEYLDNGIIGECNTCGKSFITEDDYNEECPNCII